MDDGSKMLWAEEIVDLVIVYCIAKFSVKGGWICWRSGG